MAVAGTGAARPVLLVLRALGLGDLLTAIPALRGLAEAFPDHRTVLAAPARLAPLATATGAVDAVADTPFGAGIDDGLSAETVRRRWPRPEVAVNLHGRGPQSHRLALSAEPARLLAFAHPQVPPSAGGPAWRDDEHEVVRWCRLLHAHGIAADPDDLDLEVPELPLPDTVRDATVLHPGAANPARRWPPERWAALARAERAAGRTVVVTGGPDERALARRVAADAGLSRQAILAGRTDLPTLATLVAAAGRVVCGDTGVAHLATAVGTPSVVLFGPTDPARWGPPADRPRHRVLWAGRSGDPHGQTIDPGLLRIGVDDVLAELAALDAVVGPRPRGDARSAR